ncbi:MAG: Gfo/Idh/MocA family oxidoreductase [Nitrospira sp.]|nr:Gfo/Idh/MocA family oxidoreductase [Nitrospira sp.]
MFIAPTHPKCVERLVLPADLVRPIEWVLPVEVQDEVIVHSECSRALPARLEKLKGWSAFSGNPLDDLSSAFEAAQTMLMDPSVWRRARRLSVDPRGIPLERRDGRKARGSKRKQGVLFGYGNYAKVIVLPNITPYVEIACIHEIDPLQIPLDGKAAGKWDTADNLRAEEQYDAYFLAGFHHSHAPLAVKALKSGASAVVEKPLAVDSTQLSELLTAMAESSGAFYSCFHKRYQAFNQHAYSDLRLGPGHPVSYHCIVYEVPLPSRHWYRWPNSKSRLVSNGCHWIDHFLYLNDYCDVSRADVFIARDGSINCSLELKNGALFTMVLTDQGSERVGVQDYIELRANGVTVHMRNGAVYESESRDRVLRSIRINKMESYRRMYRSIGQKIAQGLPGDSIGSVRVSTDAVLQLESKLKDAVDAENAVWV